MRVLHHTFLRGLAGAARLCLMSLALVAALALAVTAVAPAAAAAASVRVENASIEDPRAALAAGRATAADVARACTARIEAYDRAGPRLDAFAIAEATDVRKGEMRRPLEGIAVLLKDDATRDLKRPADYTRALDRDGLRGARIGIPIDPDDRAGDIYCQSLSRRAASGHAQRHGDAGGRRRHPDARRREGGARGRDGGRPRGRMVAYHGLMP